MKKHRFQSSLSTMNRQVDSVRRGPVVMSSLVLLGLGMIACGDDANPSDTIDDTQRDVDADANVGDTSDAQPEATTPGTIVINELAAVGDPVDWVELHNPGTSSVDISGWLLRDDDETHAYFFPANSVIPAGGYKVIERLDIDGFDFGLGTTDGAFLYDANNSLVDQSTWVDGESPAGASWGRIPNASGPFKTLFSPTPGAANVDPPQVCANGVREGSEVCDGTDFGGLTCQMLGWGGGTPSCLEQCTRISLTTCTAREPGLVINEVESDALDRIELYNGSQAAVNLGGYTLTDQGDNVFSIPLGTTIEAGAYLVFTRDIDHLFGLGDVDGVTLALPNGDVVDSSAWQTGQAVPALCRMPNATGGFGTCDNKTFGAENL